MAMSRAEKLAYAKGYSVAKQDRWPHEMPLPPEPVIRRLMEAVMRIRSKADELRATFDPGDEVVKIFDAVMDEADDATQSVKTWMESEISAWRK